MVSDDVAAALGAKAEPGSVARSRCGCRPASSEHGRLRWRGGVAGQFTRRCECLRSRGVDSAGRMTVTGTAAAAGFTGSSNGGGCVAPGRQQDLSRDAAIEFGWR